MTVWVDANVLLRFLTGEPKDLAESARKLFSQAEGGEVVLKVSPLVVAETIWVLGSFYEYERSRIAEVVASLLLAEGLEVVDRSLVVQAVQIMADKNVDFVDAMLAENAKAAGDAVASFDKDFKKLGVDLHAPGARLPR